MNEYITLFFQVLSVFNVLFILIIVFFERRTPLSTWAWSIVVLFVPYVGFVLYLLVGMESRKHSVFMHKAEEDQKLLSRFKRLRYRSLDFLRAKDADLGQVMRDKGIKRLNDLIHLNNTAGQSAFSRLNSVQIYTDGVTKFDALIRDIGRARRYIHMQYYIVRDSAIGRRVIDALIEATKRGVKVRFFIDGMGNFRTPKKFFKPLVDAGGELGLFLPPHFIRLNFRNHRKLAVIDGTIGYIGGLNIGDEYLGRTKRFGFWRDVHIRIYGDAVKQLQLRFMMDWNWSAAKRGLKTIDFCEEDYPKTATMSSGVAMQIVSSGPDTKWSAVHLAYAKMIFEADKSVYIATPYFIPDDTVFKALKIAGLSGIDVRIIIPGIPDHPFVYWASLSYLGQLLPAGVRCYRYEKGFIHSKMVLIDSLINSVGTANMDMRSFELNFEINAFIYCEKNTRQLESGFFADLKDCTEITMETYEARGSWTKVREAVSRLISPLL